ncbi:hypothetical protein IscW_ISCW003498 [Ixodes scapularis]|uniref:Uncharacterized protein n=1 Tax=Ixodes scapularis TaxID=6945 RepID=B7PG44_IXOSC|nr:hypothetical protein IscW_ISCW003498 [Ixodes scapularis]|eukprot:XP_002434166.1 hypothetical protein IscW_ISCW003498 [Ixodes scapularis]
MVNVPALDTPYVSRVRRFSRFLGSGVLGEDDRAALELPGRPFSGNTTPTFSASEVAVAARNRPPNHGTSFVRIASLFHGAASPSAPVLTDCELERRRGARVLGVGPTLVNEASHAPRVRLDSVTMRAAARPHLRSPRSSPGPNNGRFA